MRRLMMPTIVLAVATTAVTGCGKSEEKPATDAPATSSSAPIEPLPSPVEEVQATGPACGTPAVLDMDGQGTDAAWAAELHAPVTLDGTVRIDPAGKKVSSVSLLVAPLEDDGGSVDDPMTKPLAEAVATVTSRAPRELTAETSLELTPPTVGSYAVLVHVDYAGRPGCAPGETGEGEETVGVLTVR